MLRQSVLDVMTDAGIFQDVPDSWQQDLPVFRSVQDKLQDYAADILDPQSRFAGTTASHISKLFVFNTFRPSAQKLAWADMLGARNRAVVIQLKALEYSRTSGTRVHALAPHRLHWGS